VCIRSYEEARHANKIGLDLIITDHHPSNLRTTLKVKPLSIRNKNNDLYPYKELSGVGIAYKLAEALLIKRWTNIVINTYEYLPQELASYLDLVAIGTVADMVPLNGENRALVRLGLSQNPEKPHRSRYLFTNKSIWINCQ